MGYCRRSTDRQEQSIPDQQRTIERYCVEHGLSLLKWYVDDAISGTSSSNRPGFQQMVADAERAGPEEFGVIVVYDVKRFGRVDNDEAGYYRHLLRSRGVEVAYATEGFSGGETDDLIRPVKQWQARQESKDLSKVTIRGLLSKSQTGAWMGGVAPHGYDLRYENEKGEFLFILRHMPDGTKQMFNHKGKLVRTLDRGESLSISKRDKAQLVLSAPERVGTIRKIFSLYLEGRGLKAIADDLNRAGVPTPRGSAWSHIYAGQWRDSTVRAILVNPIYSGDMVWNRRTDARFHMIVMGQHGGTAVERRHPHGARLVPNDEADWVVIPDTHEGLVSRKVFNRAKAIRTQRPTSAEQAGKPKPVVGGWNGARSRFVLSGLVRCSLCGSRYQGVTRQKGTPRLDGTKVKTYSYACGGYIAKGVSACQFNPVGQAVLEESVTVALLQYYAVYQGKGGRERLAEAVRVVLGLEAVDVAKARARMDAERATLESTIANLLDNMTPRNRDMVEQRLGDLRQQRAALDARHGELDRVAAEEGKVQETLHEVGRFLSGLEFTLRQGLPQEQLAAMRRCIGSVVVDKARGMAELSLRRLPDLAGAASGQGLITTQISVGVAV